MVAELSLDALEGMSKAELLKALDLMKRIEEDRKWGGHLPKFFHADTEHPYSIHNLPRHRAFFAAGSTHKERVMLSANRSGKSLAAFFELSCHLTGVYPDWWPGRKFDHPVNAWVLSPSNTTFRDGLQPYLLGNPIGTGMIAKDLIDGEPTYKPNSGRCIDQLRVKHVSGGTSVVTVKSYAGSQDTVQSAAVDIALYDEEPGYAHYSEVAVRTATTKGMMVVAATPLKGITPLISTFLKTGDRLKEGPDGQLTFGEIKSDRAVIEITWDSAPWLDEAEKESILSRTPPHLRDSRSRGIPSVGSGMVYPVERRLIEASPFAIPSDWPRMFAHDPGWTNNATIWGARDPNTGVLYVYAELKESEKELSQIVHAIKERGEWVRGVVDPSANKRNPRDGKKTIDELRRLGLKIHVANNALTAGIAEVLDAMINGKLKIFTTCTKLFDELSTYSYNDNGELSTRQDDHLLDTLRYLHNTWKFATTKGQADNMSNPFGSKDAIVVPSRRYNV